MKQTNNSTEWVFIVRHSDTLHMQILDVPHKRLQRHRRWVRVLLRLLRATHKLYRAAA